MDLFEDFFTILNIRLLCGLLLGLLHFLIIRLIQTQRPLEPIALNVFPSYFLWCQYAVALST